MSALLQRGERQNLIELRPLLGRALGRLDGLARRHVDVNALRAMQAAIREQHAAVGRLIAPDEG